MRYIGLTLNKERAELFKEFLREKEIYFEPSECGSLIHFEVRTDWTYDFIDRFFNIWLEAKEA